MQSGEKARGQGAVGLTAPRSVCGYVVPEISFAAALRLAYPTPLNNEQQHISPSGVVKGSTNIAPTHVINLPFDWELLKDVDDSRFKGRR